MSLICRLRGHTPDDRCRCARCGRTVHDVEETVTWTDTGNYETSTEPWLSEKTKTTAWRCRQCGWEESVTSPPAWYIG